MATSTGDKRTVRFTSASPAEMMKTKPGRARTISRDRLAAGGRPRLVTDGDRVYARLRVPVELVPVIDQVQAEFGFKNRSDTLNVLVAFGFGRDELFPSWVQIPLGMDSDTIRRNHLPREPKSRSAVISARFGPQLYAAAVEEAEQSGHPLGVAGVLRDAVARALGATELLESRADAPVHLTGMERMAS